jgi:hypothetical protein
VEAFLLWTILACVLAIAFWIAQLVRNVNERFDEIEHKLDVVIDQLDRAQPRDQADS